MADYRKAVLQIRPGRALDERANAAYQASTSQIGIDSPHHMWRLSLKEALGKPPGGASPESRSRLPQNGCFWHPKCHVIEAVLVAKCTPQLCTRQPPTRKLIRPPTGSPSQELPIAATIFASHEMKGNVCETASLAAQATLPLYSNGSLRGANSQGSSELTRRLRSGNE